MKYVLLVRPDAEDDLRKAYEWYESCHTGLGDDYLSRVEESFNVISKNPFLHAKIHKEVRRALIHRFPYGVLYAVEQDTVTVLAVLHFRQNLAKGLGRSGQ